MTKLAILFLLIFLSSASSWGQTRQQEKCTKRARRPIITDKPRPAWPENAGHTEGTVVLRIELLAEGRIGEIRVVKGLSLGATENAIEAAKKIKFIPAIRNCSNVTAFRFVDFLFSIY